MIIVGMAALPSCNVFDPLDSPSGTAQITSAARACFDKGDYECSSTLYKQIATTDEIAAAELAFQQLDQAGVTMGVFLSAFGLGGGSVGGSITKLANALAPTAGVLTRQAIFGAYLNVNNIRTKELRGLIRFITAAALISELLAEDAGVDEKLTTADLVTNFATCNATATSCAGSLYGIATACDKPAGKKLVAGPAISDLDSLTTEDLAGTPTLRMIAATLTKLTTALDDELSSGGLLGKNSSGFASDILDNLDQTIPADPTGTLDAPCFRYALVNNGIGG
ncbi:hypothetical protein WDW86_17135 [Bdellovibrionota bacterium FG-2]